MDAIICLYFDRRAFTHFSQTNALVIAEQNAVPYLLGSIEANPNLPEEVLHMAMSLLSNLCSHSKVSAIVLREETLQSVLGVLSTNRDPLVLTSCLSIVDKISSRTQMGKDGAAGGGLRGSIVESGVESAKLQALSSIVSSSCVPSLLKALKSISSAETIDEASEDFIISATRVLSRLATSPEAVKQLKETGGIDLYLEVMETFRDSDRIARVSSKLISKMMGGNVAELMDTLNTGGLSAVAQERVLSLISSMAMDTGSMDEIMKSGGVATMIGNMEGALTARALEETARTIARLAASPKNVPQLMQSGAVGNICKVLLGGAPSVAGNLDMQASMVVALNRIAAAQPTSLDQMVEQHGDVLAGMVQNLTANPSHHGLSRAYIELFGRLGPQQLEKLDVASYCSAVLSVLGQAPGKIDPSMTSACFTALEGAVVPGTHSSRLLAAGAVPIALASLGASDDHPAVAASALGFLLHIARGSSEGLSALQAAGAFETVVEALGTHQEDAAVRSGAAALVQVIASDQLIDQFGTNLKAFAARFQSGEATDAEIGRSRPLRSG